MTKKTWIALSIIILAGAGYYFFKKPAPKATSRDQLIAAVPVSVTTVKKEKLASNLALVGTINANNDVNVISETQGVAKAVYAQVGDEVKAGTVLVQVDDELKKSGMAAAEINYQKAKRDLERNERLYQENSISALQLDAARFAAKSAENQLDIARRQLKDTRISSPITGTVNARMVEVGTMVSPGMTIANIVDISTLKVRVNVNESDAFQIKPGDKVEITTDVYPTQKFAGRIDNIASKADETHTYRVEIILANNPQYPLKAGMFARIAFTSIAAIETLVIPRLALIGSVKNAQVYLVQNNVAQLRPIVAGKESGDLIQVLEGLQEGDTVVTNGQNNLTDNTPVAVVQ